MSLLKFVQVRRDAKLPQKSSYKPSYSGDSGYDVFANFNDEDMVNTSFFGGHFFENEEGYTEESFIFIPPGKQVKVGTGLSPRISDIFWQTYMQSTMINGLIVVDYSKDPIHIPHYLELQVRPKSGRAYKEHLTITNSPGTVDNSYTGELQILLSNLGEDYIKIYHGQKIAQIVPQFVPELGQPEWVDENYECSIVYNRQEGGFGSTGI